MSIIYDSLEDLVSEYITDSPYITIEEAEELRSCSIVIEDILPSGSYEELENGEILVY